MREAQQESGSPGSTPPPPSTGSLLERLKQHAPRSTRYQLEGEIARGGMGAILKVWDADLRRNLAMKVILGREGDPGEGKTPPIEPKLLARFLEEAQITSQLDHPGIVPVHELGIDSGGRVYFTMKLVKGRELTQIFDLVFAEAEGWNETRALGVILKVCEAMAFAHQKRVIHRDLKPANVMVGDFGEVFVMDWGVARVTGQRDAHDLRLQQPGATAVLSTERHDAREADAQSPIRTMDGDIVGTPCYMPPEQARGDIQQLSARSDVYSIGAMLYHLIARHMPYCPPGEKPTNQAVLTLLLQGPPPPIESVRADVSPPLAAICRKAMQRAPEDRYADTRALAEDLRSYLENRVVKAYESGAWAQARQWVRRNRALSGSLSAAFLLLIGGSVSVAYVQAQGRKAALAELGARESMFEFLTDVIDATDPEASGLQANWSVQEIVDKGAERIQRELGEFPQVQAQLLTSIARIQSKLGLPAQAREQSRQAVELARVSYGADDPRTAVLERILATTLASTGEGAQALELLLHARQVIVDNPGVTRVEPWQFDLDIATTLVLLRRFDEALPILRSLDDGPDSPLRRPSQEHVSWLESMSNVQRGLGDIDSAEKHLQEAVAEAQELWGRKHISVARVLQNLAALHVDTNRLELALPELSEVREIRAAIGARESIEDARLAHNLAVIYNKRGELERALEESARSLALTRRFAGESAPTARAGAAFGAILFKLERYDEAEASLREALELSRSFIVRKGVAALEAPLWLARTRAKQGDLEESAKLWTEVLDCIEGDASVPAAMRAKFENDFADVLEALGRGEDAEIHRARAREPVPAK